MATVTQRLAFLISANADSAIKAFEKTSGSAAKEMAKAEKSLDKVGASLTKFGATGLAAAGVIGQQLFKAGQSASDLSESLNKTRVIFGEASKDVEDFAKGAADNLGLSQRAALDASSTFATFGKAAGLSGQDLTGFSEKLVTLSADFASFYNTSPEDAITAIGAALRGESEPIRRYGILLNDAVLKQEAMTLGIYDGNGALSNQQKVLAAQAAIMKQSTDAQGDFARTSDGLANTQRRVTATIEDLKAEVGQAALPVIQAGADAALGLAQGFIKINDATGGAITKFATFGTVGLGVISTASLITGQIIKMRDRFGEVDAETGKFNGKLTTLGKTVAVGSVALGVASLLYADYAATKAEAARVTNDLKAALDAEGDAQKKALAELITNNPEIGRSIDLLKSLGLNFVDLAKGTGNAGKQFDALAKAVKGARTDDLNFDLDKLNKTLGLNTDLTYEQAFLLLGAIQAIDMYRSATQKSADAQKIANELLDETAESADKATNSYNRLAAAFTKNFQWNEMRNRQVDRGAALAEYATMLDERLAKQQGESDKKASEAKEKFAEKVETLAEKLRTKLATALKTAEDNAAAANKAYADYQKSISGSVSGVVNLGNAQATAEENTRKLAEARTQESDAQAKLNDLLGKQVLLDDKIAIAQKTIGDDNKLNGLLEDKVALTKQITDARTDLATATDAVLTAEKQPMTFSDTLSGQVTKAEGFKTNLQKVLDLGGDQALIDQLTAAGADAGNSIITGILASSDPKKTVEDLDKTLANVAAFASAIGTASADKFFGEGVKLANALLTGVTDELSKIDVDKLAKSKNPIRALKRASTGFDSSLGFLFSENALTIPSLADGGIVPARPGGTLVRVGEAGQDEMVLPLPRQQSGSNITINVTAGMGADGTQIGRQIVDELVAYQRRVGALPIKVSG